jgi:hypothetical protein
MMNGITMIKYAAVNIEFPIVDATRVITSPLHGSGSR